MSDANRLEEQPVFPWAEPRREWVGTITEEDRAAFGTLAEKVQRDREALTRDVTDGD